MIKLPALLLATLLTACTAPKPAPALILPPQSLVEPVPEPAVPDPQTATQKTVALYLIEQQQALSLCNAQLQTLKTWRASWTSPTEPPH